MTTYTVLSILWIIFALYWIVASFGAKRTVKRNWKSFGVRLLAIIILSVLWNLSLFGLEYLMMFSLPVQVAGLLFAFVGIVFAIWARVHIGKNWGMPMAQKEIPELVTSGPYAIVRHPIYTGVLLAMLGSVLVAGMSWFIPLVFFLFYFIYSARHEERTMLKQFPEEYRHYMKKTKMLIPFLF
jgi:protein-S-isoprenylcysteine O-methyltransferase Ste14